MHNYTRGGSVRLWQRRLILSVIITIPVVYYILLDIYGLNLPLADYLSAWSAPVCFVMATIAMMYLGVSFLHSAVRGLRQRLFNVDSLVVIGTTTAYVYSWLSYLIYIIQNQTPFVVGDGAPNFYFSTVVLLFTFVTLGKWLEVRAANRAEQSVRQLIKLRPREAHLLSGNNATNIPVNQIRVGDHLLVHPGEIIPVDGQVVEGNSAVNEAVITGESALMDKHAGSFVVSGSTNDNGTLRIVATRVGENTTLARIVALIKQAQASRPPIQTAADRLANVFVPLIIAIALITYAVWYFYLGSDLSSAMTMFVSIIIIACPYAFGLAVPSVMTVGIGMGSSHGIIIQDGSAMQQLSHVDTVIFDKTGTLTSGQLSVTDIIPVNTDAKRALELAASLERMSDHSLAKALIEKATKRHIAMLPVKYFATMPHQGISGAIGGTKYYLGNEKFLRQHIHGELPDVARLTKASKIVCYLFTNRQVLAVFGIMDQPKPTAAKTVRWLHRMKITTYILSGDDEATTRTMARRLGIKHVIANVMPDDKAKEVIKLRRQGHCVAMVGDGINDAPAIASANVGIAIGTGTDAAIETGNIILVSGDPLGICSAIRLSRAAIHKAYQNLFFALFYNVISIPIATGALSIYGITMRPELAGLIMVMSLLAVIINSMTLRLVNLNKPREPIGLLAPTALFLLFTAIYLSFVFN